MSVAVRHSPTSRARARGLCVSVLVACSLATTPAAAPAAPATTGHAVTDPKLGITIPASARVQGTIPTSTTPAPTTSTPVATTSTPAATTPAATTPAGGAQPGTVAPPSTPTTPGATPAPTTTPTVSVPAATTPSTSNSTTVVGVARKPAPHKTRPSTGALALGILGVLLLLGCLVWALGRWLALEPRWTVSLMHSLREASYRASATWAEFSDWTRLGH